MRKNKKNNKYLLIGIIVFICFIVILVLVNKSNRVIKSYEELYKYNDGYRDDKYNVGTKDYFLYKSNYIFYYLYNYSMIEENNVYDTIDLDNDFVSYVTNMIYTSGNSNCFSKDMINSMSYYIFGRDINVTNNTCFNKYDNNYKDLIKDIEINDRDGLKFITFDLSTNNKYSLIYKYDSSYKTYYLYKYKFEINYDKNNYVIDEDTGERILVGQD